MNPDTFRQSVGALCRSVDTVPIETSIRVAANHLAEQPGAILPITHDAQLIGSMDDASLIKALSEDIDLDASVGKLSLVIPPIMFAWDTASEALRRFVDENVSTFIVVDADHRVLGTLSLSDLFADRRNSLRPRTIGGMATPFGVYLTNGSVSGGVGWPALVITGMLLFTLLFGSSMAAFIVSPYLEHSRLTPGWQEAVLGSLQLGLFLLAIRGLPLAGIHAAEHMVVHAIERGEELKPEIVRRMPRVHPRCGTNIAAGATLFLGIMSSRFIGDEQLRLLVAMIITAGLWRPLGSAMQSYITTKPPTKGQVQLGIQAGEDLLEKFQRSRTTAPSFGIRLLRSGLPFVMIGSTSMVLLILAFAKLFNLDLNGLVY